MSLQSRQPDMWTKDTHTHTHTHVHLLECYHLLRQCGYEGEEPEVETPSAS